MWEYVSQQMSTCSFILKGLRYWFFKNHMDVLLLFSNFRNKNGSESTFKELGYFVFTDD